MALTRVIMPKTGADMEEGRILAWKKNVGERIEKGEVLLEIETDKATMEVEAPASGFLLERLSREGEVVPATRLIAVLGEADESAEELKGMIGETPGSQEKPAVPAAVAESVRHTPSPESGTPPKASPLARRLAQEKGIDLASIRGTGPGGRIERDDVIRAAETKTTLPLSFDAVVSFSAMRRAIARRMIRSKRDMADFSVTMAMDMTAALRKKNELQAAGKHASLNDLIVFAVARTLPSHPDLNAQLEGDSLRRHRNINVGLAVGAEDGLYVPVIRNADKLSLEEIAAESKRLTDKAAQKRLTEGDMAGGTFTVSNLGMFGVESFTAIIVPPQTGILSVGCVVDRPIRDGGALAWRPTMAATLTVDHRVIDGVAAARFLSELKAQLSVL